MVDYLFVLTYGRSGSTVLNGVLNSIPGYLIRGENQGALNDLFRLYNTSERRREVTLAEIAEAGYPSGHTDVTHPWFGFEDVALSDLADHIRRLMTDVYLRPEPDTRVTGFKEIRYEPTLSTRVTQIEVETPLADVVRWMQGVFPGCRFVINLRDLTETSKSYWWADDPTAIDRLRQRDQALVGVAEELGDAAFVVKYDDYKDNPDAFRPLFEWLGESFDQKRVGSIMSVRHSYDSAGHLPTKSRMD